MWRWLPPQQSASMSLREEIKKTVKAKSRWVSNATELHQRPGHSSFKGHISASPEQIMSPCPICSGLHSSKDVLGDPRAGGKSFDCWTKDWRQMSTTTHNHTLHFVNKVEM